MRFAIDCVGHPSGAAVRAAGYSAVALYVGTPGRAKCPTPAQVQDYLAQGLELILVYEDDTGTWLGGGARGVADAQAVQAHLAELGLDWGRVGCVFFAIDSDVTAAQLPVARDYITGAASVLGAARTGVYGGRTIISDALDRGYATFAWAAAGWEHGAIDPRSHLYQQLNTVTVAGVQCDVDQIRADNYGQYPAAAPPAPPAPNGAPTSSEDAVALIDFPCTDYPADPPGGRWQDLDPAQWPRSGEVHKALVPAVPGGWRGLGSVSSITCGWAGGQDPTDSHGNPKPSGFIEYLRVFYFADITYRQLLVKDLVVNTPLVGNMSLPQQALPPWCTFLVARYAAPAGLYLGIEYQR